MSEQRKTSCGGCGGCGGCGCFCADAGGGAARWLLKGVDEDELREGLKATEDSIKSAIEASTQRTDAQMEELRGYIVNHLDRHATGEQPTN